MRRSEQPQGLQKWRHRGIRKHTDGKAGSDIAVKLTGEQIDACLRCWPGDDECTGGFFVAGFIRDDALAEDLPVSGKENGNSLDESQDEGDSEWEGFSD